jgi:hypothetical protein
MASSALLALDQNLFLAHWVAHWGQAPVDLGQTGDRHRAVLGIRGTGTGRFGGHGGQAPVDLAPTGDRPRAIWGDFGGQKG